jgi:hypothetical protein
MKRMLSKSPHNENRVVWATCRTRSGHLCVCTFFTLDPQPAAEPSGGIVGFGAVVVQENSVETAIAKQCAAEFSDV